MQKPEWRLNQCKQYIQNTSKNMSILLTVLYSLELQGNARVFAACQLFINMTHRAVRSGRRDLFVATAKDSVGHENWRRILHWCAGCWLQMALTGEMWRQQDDEHWREGDGYVQPRLLCGFWTSAIHCHEHKTYKANKNKTSSLYSSYTNLIWSTKTTEFCKFKCKLHKSSCSHSTIKLGK